MQKSCIMLKRQSFPKLLLCCRFFTFILLLFLVHSMGIALFRFMGALARNEVVASTGGSFLFLVMLLVGGFLLGKQDIPNWWIWAYWSVHWSSYSSFVSLFHRVCFEQQDCRLLLLLHMHHPPALLMHFVSILLTAAAAVHTWLGLLRLPGMHCVRNHGCQLLSADQTLCKTQHIAHSCKQVSLSWGSFCIFCCLAARSIVCDCSGDCIGNRICCAMQLSSS